MTDNIGSDHKNLQGKNRSHKRLTFRLSDGTTIMLVNRPSVVGIWYLEISVCDSRDMYLVRTGIVFNVPIVRIKNVVNFMITCAERNKFNEEDRKRVQVILNGWAK